MKICSKCKVKKPLGDFSNHKGLKDGLECWCRSCKKEYRKKYYHTNNKRILECLEKYRKGNPAYAKEAGWKSQGIGITYEEFLELTQKQNNCCAICGRAAGEGKKCLHVDHCHKTKMIRGLLCHNCNVSLGRFKDDINIILKAIEYLEGWNKGEVDNG
jgi:hypothetical protein